MAEYVTHFASEPGHTLCGQPWGAVIMNDRRATCDACVARHQAAGWTFPLPATVH